MLLTRVQNMAVLYAALEATQQVIAQRRLVLARHLSDVREDAGQALSEHCVPTWICCALILQCRVEQANA
jgi:hypothetical protein